MNALNPNNNHTLLVTATTADGRQQSQSRTFASGRAVTSVHIDLPVSQQVYSGPQTFSGWAYDNVSTISSVSLAIDGAPVGNAAYGAVRSDVCSAGQYPGCPNVGWNYAIDTTQFTSGIHTLVVTATTADSRTQTANVQFYVADQSAPSREYIYQNGKVIAIENQHRDESNSRSKHR
jgi:hypothetical protein